MANQIPLEELDRRLSVLSQVRRWNSDIAPADISHRYTEEEKLKLGNFTSLDYLPSHDETYIKWIRAKKSKRYQIERWFMMGMVGIVVGLTGFLMHQLTELISDIKWSKTREIIKEGQMVNAYFWALGYSLAFVFISSGSVIFMCPEAGGSGIPEVTGYLNGTHIPKIFSLKTYFFKFISCTAAVGANMPVGPEGPMIHLGALIGAILSQLKITWIDQFHNSEDKRNFISAGAAAGVASAFGAPLGGLLFSMEEVSSFWTNTLSWQIFFCCMTSTFTTDLLNSALTQFSYTGDFGYFKKERYILFSIAEGINVNVLMFVPTVIIGVIGGLLGALFSAISLRLMRSWKSILNKVPKLAGQIIKFIEPGILMVLMTTFSIFVPAVFSCTHFTCSVGVPWNITYGCYNDSQTEIHVEESVTRFTCPTGSIWMSSSTTFATNGTFNEVATLMFWTGEDAVKHLFSRETPLQFGYASLFSVFPFYFMMVCWATVTSIAAGTLVPMLFIGGLYGRIIGRFLISMLMLLDVKDISYWAWIDPGAFALIGAASFFGGMTGLPKAVTVIMIELTNDGQFLLPIMVSVMIAKWVADILIHPYFHSILELKCIPFLPHEPHVVIKKRFINLELFKVNTIMAHPVTQINQKESVKHLAKILLDTFHGGFPVVKSNDLVASSFCGLITRQKLNILMLKEKLFVEEDKEISPEIIPLVKYEEFHSGQNEFPNDLEEKLQRYVEEEKYCSLYINLTPYINQSQMCIPEHFSLDRTYILFRSLGLRHLVVVNQNNSVVGIVTRKDLMEYNLVDKIASELIHKAYNK